MTDAEKLAAEQAAAKLAQDKIEQERIAAEKAAEEQKKLNQGTPLGETKPSFTEEQQTFINNMVRDRLAKEKDKAAKALTIQTELTNSKVNVDDFKELKAYDAFEKLKTTEERKEFLDDLRTKKPGLFEVEKPKLKRNPLGLMGVSLETPKDTNEVKVKVY